MTTHRERLLGAARADLVALPELLAELARTLTERHAMANYNHAKITGSPAPLQLEVLHLTDHRRKPRWHGEDPRHHDITDRYGTTAILEAWVRVVAEELPEWPDLTEQATVRSEAATLVEFWPWICDQQWATELAEDVDRVTRQIRTALGVRPDYRPRCRKCSSTVIPVDADRKLTTWEACAYGACTGCDWTYPKGPALDALAQVQEPMPLAAISGILGVPVKTLHRWHADKLIAPVNGKQRGRVFDLAAVRAVANHTFGRRVG